MKQTHMRLTSGNPLVQALAMIGGILLFTAALFVGVFVFVTLLGVAVIAGVILSLRIWWLRRQIRRKGGSRPDTRTAHSRHTGTTIEGQVIARKHSSRAEQDERKR